VNEVIAVGFDNNKGVAANCRFFSVWIVFKRFSITGRPPLRPLAVESFSPRAFVVGAVASVFDTTGYAHVEDLTYTSSVVAMIFKML
jgi:hypothetical protein